MKKVNLTNNLNSKNLNSKNLNSKNLNSKNLNSKFSLSDLNILAESMKDKTLNEPYILILQFDKRTMSKTERESYSPRYIESYYTSVINGIFMQPNVSKFLIRNTARSKTGSKTGTYFAKGKLSNLSVIFTVDTTEKGSKHFYSTYRVEFKDKESLLLGLQVYMTLATQRKDKILRSKLRTYFTALALL